MKISFVIPCYNSEKTLLDVISSIKKFVHEQNIHQWEIICVSDASPDNVFTLIEGLSNADPQHIIGVELAKNQGQHAALMAGYKIASGDIIASVDDDGQMPIDSISEMLAEMGTDYDVVFGYYPKRQYNIFRNLGSKFNDIMAECLIGKPKNLKISSFFIAKKFIIDQIILYTNPFPYILGLLLQTTSRISSVPVEHNARAIGKSGYNLRKLMRLWLNGFTAFSIKPLRIASFLGAIISFFSFIGIIYLTVDKLFIHPHTPAGYSSLMISIVFLCGILMLMLGLLGEYIGRIYICINNSPQYVIRKQTNSDN